MNIAPPSNRPREISVTEPLSTAYRRVKLVLFQPFDVGKWLIIGFCAWLAQLGQTGAGGGYNFGNPTFDNHGSQPWEQMRHAYSVAHGYVMANLGWLVPVAVLAAILLVGLTILLVWLSSRGMFLFLHCVAENRAEVEAPWDKHRAVANRLFLFRLVLGLAGCFLIIPLVVMMVVLIVRMVTEGDVKIALILLTTALGLAVALVAVVLALVQKFLEDFVVPILYLRGGTCRAAWREFFQLLGGHPGAFILYILFQILLSLVLGMVLLWLILMTCCTLGCLLAIPYIGTVIMLPLLVFKRAYALYFLAQFGPAYDVFPTPGPPLVTPPPVGLRPL